MDKRVTYNNIVEESMAPVWSRQSRSASKQSAARKTNLGQDSLDILLRRRDEHAGLANFRHVRDNKVSVGRFDVDALALDFRRESGVEGRKEDFRRGIGRKHRGDNRDTSERTA